MVYVWLNKVDKLWYTTEVDNPQLLDLFGTDTLPTPYGDTTPLETLLMVLGARNPERVFQYCRDVPHMKNLVDPKHYPTKEKLLEVCVLHVLKDGGHFGFDLTKKVQNLVSDSHVLTPGKLELILKKLVLEQLVTREEKAVPYHGSLAPFYKRTHWGVRHLQDKVDKL
jgi:Transcriptional regulator PadR-like family